MEVIVGAAVATVRKRKVEAIQRLLGDTIGISEDDWQAPSRVPGWTRAHVASHLARNADGLRRLIDGALTGEPTAMYSSLVQRDRDIERGSERTALELQIDLDTSSQQLARAFDRVPESAWPVLVETPAGGFPLRLLPLARLNEVVLHHWDLDCGYPLADVDAAVARWLLEWAVLRYAHREDLPGIALESSSGLRATLGSGVDKARVRGTDAQLVYWLSGRVGSEAVEGAEGINLPRFI